MSAVPDPMDRPTLTLRRDRSSHGPQRKALAASVLVWAKRLWRCAEPACPARTWSEDCDEIAPRAVLTERVRAEICRRVGPGERSVAQAARDFGVSWHAAMAAMRDHGQPRVDHLARLALAPPARRQHGLRYPKADVGGSPGAVRSGTMRHAGRAAEPAANLLRDSSVSSARTMRWRADRRAPCAPPGENRAVHFSRSRGGEHLSWAPAR
jgi:hypothetical protein